MNDLNDLMYFAKVVEFGSFSEASRRLGIPKSRLSRRIADLEREKGVRLLQRNSRRLSLTEIGASFFERCRDIVALADSAHDLVSHASSEPRGVVRVSCPPSLAQAWLAPLLPPFLARHPRITVSLVNTSRRVLPVDDGIDIALRVREPPFPDSSEVVRKLWTLSDGLVASPAYLERHGTPAGWEALSAHATLAGPPPAGGSHRWRLTQGGPLVDIPIEPCLASDDMLVLKACALGGAGIALLPELICRQALAERRLVRVLPGWHTPERHVLAALASARGVAPATRLLIEHLDAHRPSPPFDGASAPA